MPSVWEIAEAGKGINEREEAGKRRCLAAAGPSVSLLLTETKRPAAAGTTGVLPEMSAGREQRSLAFGSSAGGTPAVPRNYLVLATLGASRVRACAASGLRG